MRIFDDSGRVAARVSTIAGAAWVMLSALSLAMPDPSRLLDAFFVVPFVLTFAALLGLHARQRDEAGPPERIGTWIAGCGMAVALGGQVALIADAGGVTDVALVLGVMLWVTGLVVLGVATVRAGLLPRRVGVGLALAQPMAVVAGVALSPISPLANSGDYSGAIAHGIIWLMIGAALREAQVVEPSPATI
jgi:hypothetical protein